MKITQDVLEVLSTMRCADTAAVIDNPKLDRKLYLDVNKALEALGGKWNRKAKAHLFPGDAAELIDAAIIAGEVVTAREMGFFRTPKALAAELVSGLGIGRPGRLTALEPSAGDGRIVKALFEAGVEHVTAVERDPARRESLLALHMQQGGDLVVRTEDDFLDVTDVKVDVVVMNPPFGKVGRGDHIDHVRHAFRMLRSGGVLRSVLPASVMFRQDRRHRAFREWVEGKGDDALAPLPDGSFAESGTQVRTCVATVHAL